MVISAHNIRVCAALFFLIRDDKLSRMRPIVENTNNLEMRLREVETKRSEVSTILFLDAFSLDNTFSAKNFQPIQLQDFAGEETYCC